jgi:hypothetical protein
MVYLVVTDSCSLDPEVRRLNPTTADTVRTWMKLDPEVRRLNPTTADTVRTWMKSIFSRQGGWQVKSSVIMDCNSLMQSSNISTKVHTSHNQTDWWRNLNHIF